MVQWKMDVSPLGSLPFKLSNPFPLLWEKEYILPIHTNPFKKVTRRIVRRYWVMMIVYIWNPNDSYFERFDPQNGRSTPEKNGQLGYRILNIYIYTWNPNDLCFGWKGPCFWGFEPQNRGQKGSRYIYIYFQYIYIYDFILGLVFSLNPCGTT